MWQKSKRIALIGILVLLILGLCLPVIPVAGVPPISLHVVDKRDLPISGVEVIQEWRNLTYEFSANSENRVSDDNGFVHFPERQLSVSPVWYVAGRVLENLSTFNPHSWSGSFASFRAAKYDSYAPFYREGEKPPEKLILMR